MEDERQEIRCVSAEIRADEEGNEIVGYAAVFDERSVDLGGFVEEIAPGAFARTLSRDPDVRATIEHKGGLSTIGRTRNGTLRLREDDRGLRFRITPPETGAGRDSLELVRGGYVNQMSFMFRVDEDQWTRKEDGPNLRRLLQIDLDDGDVSLVTYPAYPQTSAEARAKAEALSTQSDPEDDAEGGQSAGNDEGDDSDSQARAESQTPRKRIAQKKIDQMKR